MGLGPFPIYVEPGVYPQTTRVSAPTAAQPGIRHCVLIGEGDESYFVQDQLIPRGSSDNVDNLARAENVSGRFVNSQGNLITVDGTSAKFRVRNIPMVKGDGKGTITTSSADVVVTVNDVPAPVSYVNGATGEVILSGIPPADSTVKCTYYYSILNLKIDNEDASIQADGNNKIFKIKYPRIVKSIRGGVTTTDPADVKVLVNNTQVSVTAVDGLQGVITLKDAPGATAAVLISYFSNQFIDTSDNLPDDNVINLVRVGNNPSRMDYIKDVDYVLYQNTIHWGASFQITSDVVTPQSVIFDDKQVFVSLVDNKVFMDEAAGDVDGVNTEFYLSMQPTDGYGVGKPTDNIDKIEVSVGVDVETATSAIVTQLFGSLRKIVLKTAPAIGTKVFVTYYYNMLKDADFSVICQVPGATGVGTYTVYEGGTPLAKITEGVHQVADPNFGLEGIIFPNRFSDLQGVPGYSVNEVVTVTFTDAHNFTVTSTNPEGSSGSGQLGQTYIDAITGFRFTALDPQTDPSVTTPYSFVNGDRLVFDVVLGGQFLTSTTPNIQVPGTWMEVTDTEGVAVNDSALVFTFDKAGKEPTLGASYYATYEVLKTEYKDIIVRNRRDIETYIGAINTENRLALAAYIFLNQAPGSQEVVCRQLKRATNSAYASIEDYLTAIDEQATRLPGDINQDIVLPLRFDPEIINYLKDHVETMSTYLYRNNRIGMFGFPLGTSKAYVIEACKSLGSNRMVTVYPDGAIITLEDSDGSEREYVIDGMLVAAAVAGRICNPARDSAQSIINDTLSGLKRLVRELNPFDFREIVTSGCTGLRTVGVGIKVIDFYTTDMSTVLNREPTMTFIADDIEFQTISALTQYRGKKALTGIESQIVIDTETFLKTNINVIIRDFKDVVFELDPNDPTIGHLYFSYVPIFTLKWIRAHITMRTRF